MPMEEKCEHQSNQAVDIASAPRRRGRPKGLPKPPGSGRQPGTPNRVGKEARELAGKYAPKAFRKLGALLDHTDPKVVAIAAEQLLNRAYGKPVSPTEITGRDGGPIETDDPLTATERAKRIMFLFAKAAAERGTPKPRTLDGVGRVLNDEPWSANEPAELRAAGFTGPFKPDLTVVKADPFAGQREEQRQAIEASVTSDTGIDPARWQHAKAIEHHRNGAEQSGTDRKTPAVVTRKP